MRTSGFRAFDVGTMPSNSVVCMFGRRETGQNRIVKRILSVHADIPFVTLVSPTEELHGYFRRFVRPDAVVHSEYTPDVTAGFVDRQASMMRKKRLDDSINAQGVLVLDDCMVDDAWLNDISICHAVLNGRRLGIMLIMAFQTVVNVAPLVRGNVDYTIIGREKSSASRRKLFECHANVFDTFEGFCDALDAITEEGFMVIHHAADSTRLDDFVFCLKL